MQNKLTDLNNHLFAELERLGDEELSDEELSDEELDKELKRADAMSKIAQQVINNGQLALHAAELQAEYTGSWGSALLEEINGQK